MQCIRRMALIPAVLVCLALASHATERSEEWVSEAVRQLREGDAKVWRQIHWTPSLMEARRASQKENFPIFLFTHDGNIDTGRC